MNRRLLRIIVMVVFAAALGVAGCSQGNESAPLPSWAKHYAPSGTLEPNQLTIPFPSGDKFPNGEERWFLDRDMSGQLVLKVTWRDQTVFLLPVAGLGVNPAQSEIALGGKNYRVVSLTVNTVEVLTGSGWVTLEPVQSPES
jgi:hypothetical protein